MIAFKQLIIEDLAHKAGYSDINVSKSPTICAYEFAALKKSGEIYRFTISYRDIYNNSKPYILLIEKLKEGKSNDAIKK